MTARCKPMAIAVVGALGVFFGRPAEAADEIDPLAVHVSFTATDDTCPARDVFVDAVHARTRHVRIDGGGAARPAATSLDVRVLRTESGFRGELSMRDADQTTEARNIEGASCPEVVTGLALIASLMLADEATQRAQNKPREPEKRAPETRPAPAEAPAASPATATEKERTRTTLLGGGVSGGVLGGVGPGVAPAVGLFGETTFVLRGGLRPSARLLVEGAYVSRGVESGEHQYSLIQAVVRGCPVSVALGRLTLAPCVGMAGGAHRGRATQVANATNRVDLWLAPAASGAAAISLGRGLTIEVEAGVAVPLRRTRFVLAPARLLYETPAIGAFARVSLGVARFL